MALPRSLPSPIRIKGTRHKARLNLYLPRQGVGRRRGAKIECQALPHQGMSTSIAPPPKSAKLAGTRGRVSKWGRRSALLCLGSALPPRAGGASASPLAHASPLAQRGVPSLPSPSAAHRPNLETHPCSWGAFRDAACARQCTFTNRGSLHFAHPGKRLGRIDLCVVSGVGDPGPKLHAADDAYKPNTVLCPPVGVRPGPCL